MKKYFVSLLAVMLAVGTFAQNDKKAQTILDEVSAKTKSYKTIRIEFDYTMINKAQNINDSFKGVLISKGDRYKLTFSGQDIISDGKTSWTYLKDANEVQINNADSGEDSFTPTNLLSSYTENYKAKLASETAKQQIIELIPLQKKTFNKVIITIDKSRKMVQQIAIYDKNGSIYTYAVHKFETDLPFADNLFTFNASQYPGVDEIDMR
ncbi:MAG: outer membrane lipoprotein carrier protein LolA [Lentimicrobium sp.]|jgi:outer membrane lipoprotein-sorting protein|nr:outer membrane lipoprotein carrier protein LolA [Lentimicrobium sp.]